MCVGTRMAAVRMVKMRINVSPLRKEVMNSKDTVELEFIGFGIDWIQ